MKFLDKDGNVYDSYVGAGIYDVMKNSRDILQATNQKIKKSIIIITAKSSVKSAVNKITRRIFK